MSRYGLRALGEGVRPEMVAGVTTWAWADHDGFHLTGTFPAGHVPTGWVWGWGDDVWVRWRVDAHAPSVGAELRKLDPIISPYAAVEPLITRSGQAAGVPTTVIEPRFLRMAPGGPQADAVRGQPLLVIRILEPVQLTFYSLVGTGDSGD